jgi:hypothetical protein
MILRNLAFRLALLAVIGVMCLFLYQYWNRPVAQKEVLIANIINNWQQAHASDHRFNVLPEFNNEAVLDRDTGLVWEIAPRPTTITWNEARSSCANRVTGGQKGWRLPAPTEMRSLVGPAVDSPVPNIPAGHPFVNIQPTSYWTVVPEANQPSYARYVDAFLGNVLSFIKIYTYPVWCVRGPVKEEY